LALHTLVYLPTQSPSPLLLQVYKKTLRTPFILHLKFLDYLLFFFAGDRGGSSTWVRTQGFELARQVLYSVSHASSLFFALVTFQLGSGVFVASGLLHVPSG
jgi:hypothetical protein